MQGACPNAVASVDAFAVRPCLHSVVTAAEDKVGNSVDAVSIVTPSMIENIKQDLRAYEGNFGAQGFWVMVVYRFGRWRYGVRPAPLRKLMSLVYRIFYKLIQIVTRS
jgi:hypothetical protein